MSPELQKQLFEAAPLLFRQAMAAPKWKIGAPDDLSIVVISPGGVYRPAEPHFVGKKIGKITEQTLPDDGFFPAPCILLQKDSFLVVRKRRVFDQQTKFPLGHGIGAGRIVEAEIPGVDAKIRIPFRRISGDPVDVRSMSVADEQYLHFSPYS